MLTFSPGNPINNRQRIPSRKESYDGRASDTDYIENRLNDSEPPGADGRFFPPEKGPRTHAPFHLPRPRTVGTSLKPLRNINLARAYNLILVTLVVVVAVAITSIVYLNLKSQAIAHYESIAGAILDRVSATQIYFRKNLRPEVFEILDQVGDEDYFEPVWMSTSYFVRHAEAIYRDISQENIFFRESTINARSPDSEAQEFERQFILELNRDPELTERTEIRTLEGEPFLVVMRKGKTLEEACLQCHGDPADAPRGMLQQYGAERSFHREPGEIVSAYTVRIPLATAVNEAQFFTFKLSALLLATLGGIFALQFAINRRLIFSPLENIRQKANQIATEPDRLGEQIPRPFGQELAEMSEAFNSMSATLGEQRDNLEQLVGVRTKQLTKVVNRLVGDIEERKKAETALAALQRQNELILDSVWEGIFGLDKDGRATFLNPAAEKMLGWTSEELVGKNIHDIIHHSRRDGSPHPREECSAHASLVDGQVHRVTGETFWRKNGASFPVESSSVPIVENGAIVGAVITFRDITDRQKTEHKIRQLAYFDALTGLPNRRLLRDRLKALLAQERRTGGRFAVLFIDLDGFKDINDSLGHSNGDRFLRVIAERLKKSLRDCDTLARLGGDEFILIGRIQTPLDASVIARKLLFDLARPVELENQVLYSSGSIGMALYPDDGEDADTLLKNADAAMYQAKDRGKNTYQYFSEQMTSKSLERLNLVRDMRQAVERGEFQLHYQPQIDLRTRQLTGMEALLRWRHPKEGLIAPGRFIPQAEESGLILVIGEWILRTACAQAKSWQDAGYSPMKIAVNISGRQFVQPDFIDTLETILEETGVDPTSLELELTESTIMEKAEETILTLTDLRTRGIHLAIDDFGTGHSSLSYLKHFPINRLKIAQDFVRDIPDDTGDAAIVQATIAMARSLGIEIIAEGVETPEQRDFLRAHGCHHMQGFLFARPMPADKLDARLSKKFARPAQAAPAAPA